MTPRLWIAICLGLLGCGDSAPNHDASTGDGLTVDVPGADGAADGNASSGVACGDLATECPIPAQVCCDVMMGMDKCVAAGANCAGTAMACDGPEDCPSTQECCLFPDRSECLDTGICGTTGVITEVMCHVDGDCDAAANEHCCGTAPGPVVDVYGVCRAGACPQ